MPRSTGPWERGEPVRQRLALSDAPPRAPARGWLRVTLWAGVTGVLISMGFISWDVTGPVRWALGRALKQAGQWQVEVGQARWIPWWRLEVSDVQLSSPRGGRLHLVRLSVFPKPWALVRGYVAAQCEVGEIRMDPASWRIRRPAAQEILSTGPVTTDGFAIVHYRLGHLDVQQLSLHGPLLRVHVSGWFNGKQEASLSVRGEVMHVLLEAMHLGEMDQLNPPPWDPFELELEGALAQPLFRFTSAFYSMERRPQ